MVHIIAVLHAVDHGSYLHRYKGQKTPLNFVHINLSVVLLAALVIFVGASHPLRHEFVSSTPSIVIHDVTLQ